MVKNKNTGKKAPFGLLIIGNGFDKYFELPTNFGDYLKNMKDNEVPFQSFYQICNDISIIKQKEEDASNLNLSKAYLSDFKKNSRLSPNLGDQSTNYNNTITSMEDQIKTSTEAAKIVHDKLIDISKQIKKIKKSKCKISFWDMYLILLQENMFTAKYLKNTNMGSWQDVEQNLKNFLDNHSNGSFVYSFRNRNKALMDYLLENDDLSNKQNFGTGLFSDADLNFIIFTLSGYEPNDSDFLSDLKKELNSFESNFAKYLNKINFKNSYLTKNRYKLINRIQQNEPYNILNFNYTPLKISSENDLKQLGFIKTWGFPKIIQYIHGNLGFKNEDKKQNIIIGIDNGHYQTRKISSQAKIQLNEREYKFTKVFQVLEKNSGKSIPILNENISNISFFGHSLGKQDFGYFYTIFKYFKIETNHHISLTFYWSPYKNSKGQLVGKDGIPSHYLSAINELINTYAKKEIEKTEPGSLLQRMQIENRISIKKIPPFEELKKQKNE